MKQINLITSNKKASTALSNAHGEVYFFADIETYKYNLKAEKPTHYKTTDYSHRAVMETIDGTTYYLKHRTLSEFLMWVWKVLEPTKRKQKIKLRFFYHNAMGYDSHFFRKAMIETFDIESHSKKLPKAVKNAKNAMKKAQLRHDHTFILETRVRSKSSLHLEGNICKTPFEVVDTLPKFRNSLAKIGKILNELNILPKKYLKTSYKYDEFDTLLNLTDSQALKRVYTINRLHWDEEHEIYVRNDVVLLWYAWTYYNDIYPSFDKELYSLAMNSGKAFTSYQGAEIQLNGYKSVLGYSASDVMVSKTQTLQEFVQAFLRGGMNFINDKYLEKIVNNCFSVDINSSYPYVFYKEKIPDKLISFKHKQKLLIKSAVEDYEHMVFAEIEEKEFFTKINKIRSRVVRSMFIKRYGTLDGVVRVTSWDLRNITRFIRITSFNCITLATYECHEFMAKDEIFKNYNIKTVNKFAKAGKTIKMTDPFTYEILDERPKHVFDDSLVITSKEINNSIYGYTILRPYYHTAQYNEQGELEITHNNLVNTPRNNPVGVMITATAFYNLLEPLTFLTMSQIDDYFIYCDTDSLYLKKEAYKLIPKSFYDGIKLGGWDVEHENIKHIFVNNHKKYCFESEKGFTVHAGGVSKDTQKRLVEISNTFEDLTKQLSTGSKFKVTRSITNRELLPVIYEGELELKAKNPYVTKWDEATSFLKKIEFELAKKYASEAKDSLYFEGDFGSYGMSELFDKPENVTGQFTPVNFFISDLRNLKN